MQSFTTDKDFSCSIKFLHGIVSGKVYVVLNFCCCVYKMSDQIFMAFDFSNETSSGRID